MTTILAGVTIEPAGDGAWDVGLPERWTAARNQNGGVLIAAASGAVSAAAGQPHPDGELRDASGQLVARFRQLGLLLRAGRPTAGRSQP